MSQKRRDSRNRILNTGESQRKDGRYVYKYLDENKNPRFVYSWKLVPNDRIPDRKRNDISLREKEAQIIRDKADEMDRSGSKYTVHDLYCKYTREKNNIKPNTELSRTYLLNKLKATSFGKMKICNVKVKDAKAWIISLNEKDYSYNSIKNHKRSLSAAFQWAVQSDYIRKNPFKFNIDDVIKSDTRTKKALSLYEQQEFINYLINDGVYKKNYPEVIILLETGLRISELCGLTLHDIDLDERKITVSHQLLKSRGHGMYISTPKSKAGYREIYMTDNVYSAFAQILKVRKNVRNIVINGYTDFIFLDKNQNPKTASCYDALFRRISKRFKNHTNSEINVNITPHTLRHTFCTNMANAGMNPKALQYIMGHSDVSLTLNYYTHENFESVKSEMQRISA